MPTYEYRCKSCGEQLEVVQSFSDDALTDCPACGSAGQLRKVFGTIGITFKGSGFYKTDSRAGSKTATRKKDDAAASTSTSTSSSTESSSSSGSSTSGDSSSSSKSASSSSTSSSSAA